MRREPAIEDLKCRQFFGETPYDSTVFVERSYMRKGFTLIELLVVIAIIALLLSIMVPSLNMAKEVARRTICATHLKALGQGLVVYGNKNDEKLPPSYYKTSDPMFGSPSASYTLFVLNLGLSPAQTTDLQQLINRTWGFGYLFMSDIIGNAEVFYCPSTMGPTGTGALGVSYRYEQYSENGTRAFPWNNDYNTPGAWNPHLVRSGYNYVPQAGRTRKEVRSSGGTGFFPEIAQKTFQLNSTDVTATDLLFHKDFLPHKKGGGKYAAGVNTLFADSSVRFSNNAEAFSDDIWENPSILRVGNDEYSFRLVLTLLK